MTTIAPNKKIAQSLRDSIEKELLKVENKQDTKTLKKKIAKEIKQVLHNYLKPKNFKVEITIEPKARVIKARIKKEKNNVY